MKSLPTIVLASVVALSATTAWAQMGLYGSPEVLSYGQYVPPAVAYGGYATQPVYTRPVYAPPVYAPPVHMVRPAPAYAYGYQRAMPRPVVRHQPRAYVPASPGVRYGYAPNEVPPPRVLRSGKSQVVSNFQERPIAAPSGGAATVDRMLVEQGNQPAAGYNGCTPLPYAGECCPDASCGRCCCPWYASVHALVMGRNNPDRLWTSYEDGNAANQLPPFVNPQWRWGGEVRFGRRFCCGCYGQIGLEATYWTLDPFTSFKSITHPNDVSTPLIFGQGNIRFGGEAAQNWFDGADEHRVWRRDEVHSAEINLVCNRYGYGYDSPVDFAWSLGVRFFRFEDSLTFASLRKDGSWNDLSDAAYLNDRIINNLIGVQLGADAGYCVGSCCRFFVTPKLGIYNNHITNDFRLNLGDGTVATQDAYPNDGYPVHSQKDVVSFLTQIDLGTEWMFCERWSVRIGYRLVLLTNVGLADHQIPTYITDIPEIRAIDHNANLILHGGFIGLAYNF